MSIVSLEFSLEFPPAILRTGALSVEHAARDVPLQCPDNDRTVLPRERLS